jgi:hypothetical protein
MRFGLLFFTIVVGLMHLPARADEYQFDFKKELDSEDPTFVFPSLNGVLCFHASCIPPEYISERQCTYGKTHCTAHVSGDFKTRPSEPEFGFTLFLWGAAITEEERLALTTPPDPNRLTTLTVEMYWNTEDEVFGFVPAGEVAGDLAAPVAPTFFRETSISDTRSNRTGTAICNWSLGTRSSAKGRRCIVKVMTIDGKTYERAKIGSRKYISGDRMRAVSAGFSGDSDLATVAGHEVFLAAIEQKLFIDTLLAQPELILREDTDGSWSRVFSSGRRLSLIDPQLNEDTEVVLDFIYLGPSVMRDTITGEETWLSNYRIKWRVYSFVSRLNSADPDAWTMPSSVFREAYEALMRGTIETITAQFQR